MKGHFTGAFDPEWVDGNWFKIHQHADSPFTFTLDDGRSIVPPDGFYTDMASVPPIGRIFLPKTGDGKRGQYAQAAAIHDFLYETGQIDGKDITRKEADEIFLAALTAMKVSRHRRQFMYMAVRIGGGKYFKNPNELNKLRKK